ncbi:MAG: pyridoxamine kinase [Clostridiales bacterium]|nr:pyridoxamine kinase [Clostridiales bacterium]
MNQNLKVAAIHDISGVGRCSLTVIIPILSAMGIQVCPVPTVVLSAHTGYNGFVMRDLTDYIDPALAHYKQMKIKFDCIYSGFLASDEQIDHCRDFFNAYPNALKVCDPVMGDNGKPYKTYTNELCNRMVELAAVADIITPNLTEASILLGEKYPTAQLRTTEVKSWLVRLSEKGPKTVVITTVPLADGSICNVGYDRETNTFWKVNCDYVPRHYSGSGDMFSSVLVGGIAKGDSLPIAIDRATSFTELAIKTTFSYQTDTRDGIIFEPCLKWLTDYQVLRNFKTL